MQLDYLSIWILAAIGLLASIGLIFWSFKRYEVAVFMMVLSPWVTAISFGATNIPADELEPGIRSYIRVSILLLTGLVGIITFFKLRSESKERIPFDFVILGAFILLALVSTGYSIDPRFSFMRSVSFAALFAFLLGLHYWLSDKYQFDLILGILFGFVLLATFLNIGALVLLPGETWEPMGNRFRGLWGHPNTMGAFCMLSYPLCLWKYSRASTMGRCLVAGVITALAIMHFLTGSRSSMICAILGITLWLFIKKGKMISLFFILGIGFLMVLMVSMIQVKPSSLEREPGEGISSLTGRTEFWSGAYMLILERPVLGYGYGVEGKVWEDPRFHDPELALWSGSAKVSLHNGYISVAIGLGIIGFFLWCVILFLPLWRGIHSYSTDYKAFVMSIMLMLLLSNFVEGAINHGTSIDAVFYWIAWVMAERLSLRGIEEGFSEEAM